MLFVESAQEIKMRVFFVSILLTKKQTFSSADELLMSDGSTLDAEVN
jgi:hypothetical protein